MLEDWFSYALVSAIFFGFTTIVDKLMLEKRLSSFSYLISYVPPALTFSIWVLLDFPVRLSFPYVIGFVAGLLSAGGYFLYVISIRKEEASRIAALTSLSPAFVAVLAFFLVNEIFPAQSYIGIILMILGSALISYKRNHVKKMIPYSLVAILIATNFSYGLDQTFSKISIDQITFLPFLMMFMFGRFAIAIAGLAISPVRTKFISEIKKLGTNFTLTLASGSIMWSLGAIFLFYAASIGPITLVSTTGLISPLFTLLFAILITKYLPKVLEEEIDGKTVALKLVAIIMIFIGTYLIIT
ncbi:MAG TPA: EamA family transporter [Candidatus Acidoferrum sp.]|nr:EamA family transporter [Candidatus Acidoferrum sp.]